MKHKRETKINRIKRNFIFFIIKSFHSNITTTRNMDSYEDIYSDDFFESEHEDEFSTIEVSKRIVNKYHYDTVNKKIHIIFEFNHMRYLHCLKIGRSGEKFG